MKISKIKPDDWYILKTLLVESVKESPDAFSVISNEDSPDHYWRGLANKYSIRQNEVAYKLADDQVYFGILIGSETNVGHIWVSPRLRRSGYGKKLMGTYLEWVRKRKRTNIHLFVTEDTPAIKFYESLGFKSTGEREEPRPRSGKWMIKMELNLFTVVP